MGTRRLVSLTDLGLARALDEAFRNDFARTLSLDVASLVRPFDDDAERVLAGPHGLGASSVRFMLDHAPAARLAVRVAIVRRLAIEARRARGGGLFKTPADRDRDEALASLGWSDRGNFADCTWELSSGDPVEVAQLEEAVRTALLACRVPAGIELSLSIPGSGLYRYEGPPGDRTVPYDERWVDEARAGDLWSRVVRLSSLRGGHISVRYARDPTAVLAISARRRGQAIEAQVHPENVPPSPGRDNGGDERFVLSHDGRDAGRLFTAVEATLARLSRIADSGTLSLRLEVVGEQVRYKEVESSAFFWAFSGRSRRSRSPSSSRTSRRPLPRPRSSPRSDYGLIGRTGWAWACS